MSIARQSAAVTANEALSDGSGPAVSVILPFLNAERFLAEAIESVIAQARSEWELLLVDDGSADGSAAIAHRYAARMPERIRCLEHPGRENRGTAAARNLGIRHAKGRYVAFLDADDVFLPDNLARQAAILDACREAGMVMGGTRHWHSWEGSGTDRLRKTGPLKPGALIHPPELVPLFLSGRVETPGVCSVLIRRETLLAAGGFDEPLRDLFEDAALFYKLALAVPVYVDGACSALYRQHAGSVCHRAARERRYHALLPSPAHFAFLTWLQGYIAARGPVDPCLGRSLDRAFWPYRHPLAAVPLKGGEYIVRSFRECARQAARHLLPFSRKQHAPGFALHFRPPVGAVRFGSLRRVTPISRDFGYDRGRPLDRRYIERFLESRAGDIRGRVLEIGDNTYTVQYGGGGVTQSDVLHVTPGAPAATIIGDLSRAGDLPEEAFDCIILTQTLHLIYDMRAALDNVYRSLRPGGVLLATVPGISHVGFDEWGDRWYWSFTLLSARRLFGDVFGEAGIVAETHGNVLAAIAYLHGIAMEELRPEELDSNDPHYPVIITLRAVRAAGPTVSPAERPA